MREFLTPEFSNALPCAAALLLVVATLAWSLALLKVGRRWGRKGQGIRMVATVARVGAVLSLTVALILEAGARGAWSPWAVVTQPPGLRQATLGLAVATLVVYLVLVWRFRVDAVAPVVDLIALGLILTGTLANQSPVSLLTNVWRAAPVQIQWILFVLGAGGLMVAGSAGLMLAFRAGLAGRWDLQWDLPRSHRTDLHLFLKQATALALVALGGGLAVSIWWAGQTLGTLSSGGSSENWIAIAWLITAMSMLARRAARRWGRWTAGLAVMAAAAAIFGLLAPTGLCSLLGM